MEDLLPTGRVRHIGVSNFSPAQLSDLMSRKNKVDPFAHQMELHPYLQQEDWVNFHHKHNIHVTAYSPFGNTNPTYSHSRKNQVAKTVPPLLETRTMKEIASSRGCTAAQVALAWGVGRNTSVIPKSAHQSRIEENANSVNCKLEASDLSIMQSGFPVKRFSNPSKNLGVELFEGLEDAASQDMGGALARVLEGVAGRINSIWRRLWRYVVDGKELR